MRTRPEPGRSLASRATASHAAVVRVELLLGLRYDRRGEGTNASEMVRPTYRLVLGGSTLAVAGCFALVDVDGLAGVEASPDARPADVEAGLDAPPANVEAGPDAPPADAKPESAATYVSTVLADMPKSYWRMRETGGVAAVGDESKAFPLTLRGSYVAGVPGLVAADDTRAISFSGTSGYAEADNSLDFAGTMPFSLEAWVMDVVPNARYQHVFSKDDRFPGGGSQREQFGVYIKVDEGIVFERYVKGVGVKATAPLPSSFSKPVHIVATYSGASMTLFVDGVTQAIAADARTAAAKNVGFIVAGDDLDANRALRGVIDEVAVYDHVLMPERVSSHHEIGVRK